MSKIQIDMARLLPSAEELINFAAIVKDWENSVEVICSEEDEEIFAEFDENCLALGLDKGVILQALTVLDVLYQAQPKDPLEGSIEGATDE